MVMQSLSFVSASDLQVFIDNPAQLLQESEELQLAVASCVDTPRKLLEVLASSSVEKVAEAARLHVNYAGEIADKWEQVASEMLRSRQMGQNDRLAVELLRLGAVPPCFLSKWVPADKLIAALRNPQMPLRYRLELLERLAQEDILEPRLQVAESSETPLAVLEQLAGDLQLAVRLAVKFNPSCPPALIELVEGQHAVASDWKADAAELSELGRSRWAWIRLAIAQNPNTREAMLKSLAGDEVYKIRLAVAKNPSTSPTILALLAKSEDTNIRVAIAEHGNLTEEIMHELFPSQQSVLRKRKALPSSILERFFKERVADKPLWKDYDLRYLLLSQENTPTWILAELTKIDLEALKAEKLAQEMPGGSTPGISQEWVEDELIFLVDVVKHPQVSLEILDKLVDYPNLAIALAVAENSQVSEAIQLQIFENLISSNQRNIIQKIASNPKVPISILEKIAESESSPNQFRIKLRKLLTRKPNADNRESNADLYMDEVHKVLTEYKIGVDVEEWMSVIESYQWMTLLEDPNYVGKLSRRYSIDVQFREMVDEQWQELLPTIPTSALQKVINSIVQIPDALVGAIAQERTVSVALVGNPNTPIALREKLKRKLTKPLEELSGYRGDSDLRMALAYNLAIPESERIEYLRQLLANSGGGTREQIARNPATPLEIITQIMSRPGSDRQAVSRNPNAPINALAELALDDNSLTREWVAENPATPVEILVQLARLPIEKEEMGRTFIQASVREAALKNPKFPTLERYRLLIETEEAEEVTEVHQLMARRSDSPYALAQVVEKGDRNAKMTAARSRNTPIHVLEKLAKDADEIIRSVVIENPNLPFSSLLELAKDSNVNIRAGLARDRRNQTVQIELLEMLAKDESSMVRAQVAVNSNTPIEILKQLATDTSAEVLNALTRNQNTPVEVLEFVGVEKGIVNIYNAKTPGKALEKAVEKALQSYDRDKELDNLLKAVQGSQMPANVLARLANYKTSWVRSSVAAHPNTPISALEPLLNDDYAPVLWAIARRADAPPHYLKRLLQGKQKGSQDYEQILFSICNKCEIPPSLLGILIESKDLRVYDRVATQANLPSEILETLLATANESILTSLARNESSSDEILSRLAEHQNPNVCAVIARRSNIKPQIWEQLARSNDASVRQVVATNRDTPVDILKMLASDIDNNIRAKIASNSSSPMEVLEKLATDADALVRTAVASNHSLAEAILKPLSTDEKVEVRRAVATNPNTPASILDNLGDLINVKPKNQPNISPTLRSLGRLYNPETDDLPTILGEYARSENDFVRFIVLMNPQTPLEILLEGMRSSSWVERYAVAENMAVTAQMKQYLVADSNRIVRAAVSVNR